MKGKFILLLIVPALFLCACTSTTANPTNTQTPQVTELTTPTIKSTVSENTDNASKATSTVTAKQTASSNVSKTTLTKIELNYFTSYFNKNENNGFLQSFYTKPSALDLNEALYNGAGYEQASLTTEEAKLYSQKAKQEITTDVTKLTTSQINTVLKNKTSLSLKDITKKFNWTYLEKYDAYYFQHGDTNYSTVECISGYKTSSDSYVIKYKSNNTMTENQTFTVLCKKKAVTTYSYLI